MDFKEKFGLTENDNKKLNDIVDNIFGFSDLDEKMDYVDGLVLWNEFSDEYIDELLDEIDEYLRDLVE